MLFAFPFEAIEYKNEIINIPKMMITGNGEISDDAILHETMMEEMPKELYEFNKMIHNEEPDCGKCEYSCCSQSGFAVRKNVEYIYQIYQRGDLVRNGFVFQAGLSFTDFVNRYFDIVKRTELNLDMYFPRHLDGNNSVISIPFEYDGDFYNIRDSILGDPNRKSRGCIFLKNYPGSGDQTSKECILHDSKIHDSLYSKPIDCIFLTCSREMKVKRLDEFQELKYFEMIAKYYHN
jgi:hypothetical protein